MVAHRTWGGGLFVKAKIALNIIFEAGLFADWVLGTQGKVFHEHFDNVTSLPDCWLISLYR